jgi:hypothetical protein
MKAIQINPVLRAIWVVGSVAVLVTGVTFAAMQDQASLTGVNMASATADLKVDGADSLVGYSQSEASAFDFNGLIPGGAAVSETFKLKNEGSTDLDIVVKVTPVTTVNIDKDLIKVKFINQDKSVEAEYTLTALESNTGLPGISGPVDASGIGALEDGGVEAFKMEVRLEAGAVTGTGGSVDAFDLIFTGTNNAEVTH